MAPYFPDQETIDARDAFGLACPDQTIAAMGQRLTLPGCCRPDTICGNVVDLSMLAPGANFGCANGSTFLDVPRRRSAALVRRRLRQHEQRGRLGQQQRHRPLSDAPSIPRQCSVSFPSRCTFVGMSSSRPPKPIAAIIAATAIPAVA